MDIHIAGVEPEGGKPRGKSKIKTTFTVCGHWFLRQVVVPMEDTGFATCEECLEEIDNGRKQSRRFQ